MKQIAKRKTQKCVLATAVALGYLASTTPAYPQQWSASGNDIYNTNLGNVGIGTTAPGSKLEIKNGDLLFTGTAADRNIRLNPGTGAGGAGIDYTTASGLMQFYNGPGSDTRMVITNGGSVGIGTTAPGSKLEINNGDLLFTGTAADRVVRLNQGGSGAGGAGIDYTTGSGLMQFYNGPGSDTRMVITNGGNVGIGTSGPQTNLDVKASFNTGPGLVVTGGTFVAGKGVPIASLGFSQMNYTSGNRYLAAIEAQGGDDTYADRGQLAFKTGYLGPTGGPPSTKMTIDFSGNVGIGTTTPSSRLHVAGDVTVTGSISAKYQDIAEWVPASQQILPGSVVVLDRKQKNVVKPSSEAYDTRVAGVVSQDPGITLGEADEGKVKVATTGRVLVRVDATRAPIEAGDLLVTSDKVGVAMRSAPVQFAGVQMHRPGTLIGKALEPLENGEGEILVLLSLQ